MKRNHKTTPLRYYFVDEAGDATIFDGRGRVLIGEQGCSRYFILGVLDVPDPAGLQKELEELRLSLLADSYFKNVPSIQPGSRKTALMFHAKDDLPEVRREVFAVLKKHPLRFLAVVRNKKRVLEYVQQRNALDVNYRYHPNELYDYMVRVLFKTLLHKDERYEIYFSKRWKQDRTNALRQAIGTAQQRFAKQSGIQSTSEVIIIPQKSQESGGFQAVDYFLWALQRFYERREDRYLEFLWDSFRLVHDLDDTRKNPYGVYYTKKEPLTLAALDDDLPGI
jgi:hypothetical protein